MKRTKLILIAFLSMLIGLTFASCGKDNNNGVNGTEQPINDSLPQPFTMNWVDLGLPSGLLWAECNLGATKPEEYGEYYAWGETEPKEEYSWTTYHYGIVDEEGKLLALTKYNVRSDYGTVDSLTILEAMDDAAAALGDGARTPTKEEWEELMENTTAQWTTVNGVNGRKFTATNGNTLFLPAAGTRWGSDPPAPVGDAGAYWSSSLYTVYPTVAWYFRFNSDEYGMMMFETDGIRFFGRSVRPVRARQN